MCYGYITIMLWYLLINDAIIGSVYHNIEMLQ